MSELERKKHAIFERDTQGQEIGSRQSTPEQNEMSKRLIELNLKIHLEIETFYSNAKILLDHIAHAIYAHFGQAQHCSLESHDRFLKDFDKYVSQKGLSVPEGMREREVAKGLSKRIIVFRDKMINHEMDPNRSHGICMFQGAEPLVFSQKIEGTLDDFRSTEPLSVLMRDIERYIVYFMTVIKENEAKTVLKLAAVPSWEKQRPDSYPEKQV